MLLAERMGDSESPERVRANRFIDVLMSQPLVQRWDRRNSIDMNAEDRIAASVRMFSATHAESGLFLPDDVLDSGVNVESFQPLRTRGGKQSRHHVFFGNLVFDTGDILSVAVKPHEIENNKRGALVDQYSTHIAEKLGFYTLKPAGVLISDTHNEDVAYSFSVLDRSLTTFDSINWRYFANDMENNPGMKDLWRSIAGQVAMLHDTGQSMHGDLAARNIAASGNRGAFLIDWEGARFSGLPPRDPEVRYQYSHTDLSSLLQSMAYPTTDLLKPGVEIFHAEVDDWWQAFKDVFLDDYMIARQIMSEEGDHNRQRHLDIEEELQVLEKSLKADCEMFRDLIGG